MNEVIKGVVMPVKGSIVLNIPNEHEKPAGIIDITPIMEAKEPFHTVVYSGNNLPQYIQATSSIVKIEDGQNIALESIPHATKDTGDIAVEVENIPLPETIRNGKYQGIISNERGAVAWQGNSRLIITSLTSPVHPITGEPLAAPVHTTASLANSINTLPSPQAVEPITASTSPAQQFDLENNSFLQAPAKLDEAA